MLIDNAEDLKLDLTANNWAGRTGFQLAIGPCTGNPDVADLIRRKKPSLVCDSARHQYNLRKRKAK